jgi:fido (protein-threonine AMPylation protein)
LRVSHSTDSQLPAMGEIYSEFLDELLQNIRARPISWEAQQRSGVIDDADVRTVKSIDKQRRDKRSEIVAKVTELLMRSRGVS